MADRPIIFSPKFPPGAVLKSIEAFMDYVHPVTFSGCWLWTGPLNTKGYGRAGGKELAHRVAVRHFGRSIPVGMEVDHLCRVRCCVNPDHLDIVTHRVNVLRGNTLAAIAVAKTNCPAGHPLAGQNVLIRQGKRSCRECDRLRHVASYQTTTTRRRRSHLRPDEISQIRSLIEDGSSHSEIAQALEVSIATVSNVRRRLYRRER